MLQTSADPPPEWFSRTTLLRFSAEVLDPGSTRLTEHLHLDLPGSDLVAVGIADLEGGVESVSALLVSIGAPRLASLGLALPRTVPNAERRLYELLGHDDPDAAHSRYNALVRRLVSFERALACSALGDADRIRKFMQALAADRSPFVARHGRLSFHHFDLYAHALAKVERGHAQDMADVREMQRRALEYFRRIEPDLYRYPAIDPAAFRRAAEAAFA